MERQRRGKMTSVSQERYWVTKERNSSTEHVWEKNEASAFPMVYGKLTISCAVKIHHLPKLKLSLLLGYRKAHCDSFLGKTPCGLSSVYTKFVAQGMTHRESMRQETVVLRKLRLVPFPWTLSIALFCTTLLLPRLSLGKNPGGIFFLMCEINARRKSSRTFILFIRIPSLKLRQLLSRSFLIH